MQATFNDLPVMVSRLEEGITELKSLLVELRDREPAPEKKVVYGLKGIAEIFNCGITRAQHIKQSGVIDGAISRVGGKIVVDYHEALRLTKVSNKKKKRIYK